MRPGVYVSPAAGKVRLTPEGKLHREGNPGLLAGSASTLMDGVRNVSRMEGLARAWNMASVVPSRLMNRGNGHGLHVGAHADLVLLDHRKEKISIREVFKNGEGWKPGDGSLSNP